MPKKQNQKIEESETEQKQNKGLSKEKDEGQKV